MVPLLPTIPMNARRWAAPSLPAEVIPVRFSDVLGKKAAWHGWGVVPVNARICWKACLNAFRSQPTQRQHFLFWNFQWRYVWRRFQDSHRVEGRHLRRAWSSDSQMVDRAITDPGTVRLLAVTLRKRTQTGSFTINVADGQPRIGAADDLVNLLCHFIGNRMIPRFWRCDIKHKDY